MSAVGRAQERRGVWEMEKGGGEELQEGSRCIGKSTDREWKDKLHGKGCGHGEGFRKVVGVRVR